MTEDEAKEKWCPFPTGINTLVASHKCWTSECMAWVWDDVIEEIGSVARIVHHNASSTSGHCGMVK